MNLKKTGSVSAGATRHLTLFFSELTGLAELSQRLGDLEASRVAGRLLALEEIIITRDGLGKVMHIGQDALYAVFENASGALNRALEIQRVVDGSRKVGGRGGPLRVRIGLHTGELLVKEGERLEVIGRHVTRGRKVMEIAGPGQIMASDAVTNAARELVDIPKEFLGIEYFGEFYLKGAGATALCEVADLRFRKPEAPSLPEAGSFESAVMGRLELAGYRPLARLGEGVFGVVYQAEQQGSGRTVAVKVLEAALTENAAGRQRFAQQLVRLRKLALAGVVSILDERLDHQPPFFVMELVAGTRMDTALAGASAKRVARVFKSIASILAEAHAAGMVHGDLKPGNILIRPDDTPVILDFGMAFLEVPPKGSDRPTFPFGTPVYAAPERIRGEPRTCQTDIYALGILLFEILTGREPFAGESIHEVVQAHLHEDPPMPVQFRPEISDGLQRICLKSLEKDPADRYENPPALAADLNRFIRGDTIRTRPSAYDNLLFHRVRQHVDQIGEWARRGLLNPEEHNRLLSAYDGLQRRGLSAVMEGRQYRFWQIMVYLGGWAILNGVSFWLIRFWGDLGHGTKLALGSVPALTAFGLAAAMWRVERFRLTFVALIVAIMAVPLATGVWLHEFDIARTVPTDGQQNELFTASNRMVNEGPGSDSHEETSPAAGRAVGPESYPLTNRQLFWSVLAAWVVGAGIMRFTRTTLHSAQVVFLTCCSYSVWLLGWGLRPRVEANDWARVGWMHVPLLVGVSAVGWVLMRSRDRQNQAAPWHYGAALLLMGILYALSLDLLDELGLANLDHAGTYLLLASAGVVQTWIGLEARGRLRHRSRAATWWVTFIGLLNILMGLGMAGWEGRWPEHWWRLRVFAGEEVAVPLAHLLLPLVCLVMAALACRYQMFSFLFAGLTGFAVSVHLLGYLYFGNVQAWPGLLILFGSLSLAAALYNELRQTRGNTLDDVVLRTRL